MRKQNSVGGARYAIYLRCSTDDQAAGDYTTIDTQREINTCHVSNCGGILVGEYADEGRTGTNLKRKGYRELLRDAEAGLFDAVCCTYMSRLARGEAHTVAEWQLKEAGIRIEYVKEKFTDDMAGYVNKQMTRFMDGMYPQMVREWTITKMEQMFQAGYFCGGAVPFGYRLEPVHSAMGNNGARSDKQPPKKLVPDEEAVPIVLEAFHLFVATRNATVVLEYLRRVTDRRWSYTKASYLLKNRVYRGVARWGKHVNEAAHEAIIPEELWNAAQEIFAQGAENRARRPKRNVAAPHAYFLRGLVVCRNCGGKMTTADHVGRRAPVRYYECIQAVKQGNKTCPVCRVNADMLHQIVVGEIRRMADHPWRVRTLMEEAVRRLPQIGSLEAEEKTAVRRLREIEKKVERLTEAIASAGASSRAVMPLVRKLETLEADRIELQQERHRISREVSAAKVTRPTVADLHQVFGRFIELWDAATEEERAEMLPLIVGRVAMDTKQKGSLQILLNLRTPLRPIGDSSLLREDNLPLYQNPDIFEIPLCLPSRAKCRPLVEA